MKQCNHEQVIQIFSRLIEAGPPHPGSLLLISGGFGSGKTWLLSRLIEKCVDEKISYKHLSISGNSISELAKDIYTYTDTLCHDDREPSFVSEESLSYFDLPLFEFSYPLKAKSQDDSDIFRLFADKVNSASQGHKFVLLIDANSAGPQLLDSLRSMLFEHFDGRILVVITTRHHYPFSLPWTGLNFTHVRLEGLSIGKARDLLNSLGCHLDDTALSWLLEFTEGNPYLLQLAAKNYLSGMRDLDSIQAAVAHGGIERALVEVDNAADRESVRLFAVIRWSNLEAFRRLTRSKHFATRYSKLSRFSFVESVEGGLCLDPLLRKLFLVRWKLEAPSRFEELNRHVLTYFRGIANQADGPTGIRYRATRIYHELQDNEVGGIEAATEEIIYAVHSFNPALSEAVLAEIEAFPFTVENKEAWLNYFSAMTHQDDFDLQEMQDKVKATLSNAFWDAKVKGYILACLSERLLTIGAWQDAEKVAKQAIQCLLSTESDSSVGLFYARLSLMNALLYQHHWGLAETEAETLRSALAKNHSRILEFLFLCSVADLNRAQGIWDSAYKALIRAAGINENNLRHKVTARISLAYGKLYRDRQEWRTAANYFTQCIQQCRVQSGRQLLAQALHSLATVRIRQGLLTEAEQLLLESKAIKQMIRDIYGEGKTHNSLAHIARMQGSHLDAFNKYTKAYDCFLQAANPFKASRVLCRIGITLSQIGKESEAIIYLKRSLALRLSLMDSQGVSECHFELGRIYENSGEQIQAINEYRQSLSFAKGSNSSTRQLSPLVQLAAISFVENEVSGGSKCVYDARDVVMKSRQYSLLSSLYADRARFELERGHIKVGLLLLTEAVYISSFESDRATLRMLHALWDAIVEVSHQNLKSTCEDYCRRSLAYWRRYCPALPIQSDVWKLLLEGTSAYVEGVTCCSTWIESILAQAETSYTASVA